MEDERELSDIPLPPGRRPLPASECPVRGTAELPFLQDLMQWNGGWWRLPNLVVQDNWACQIDLTEARELELDVNLRLL